MRGVFLASGVLLTLGLAAPMAAQDAMTPLSRVVDVSIRLFTTVDDCTVPRTVLHLVRRFGILAGIEYLRSPCAKVGAPDGAHGPFIDLKGLTVADALSKVLAIDRRYRMVVHDGVVVVRPVQALADPKNMLNFTASSFVLEDTTLGLALDRLQSAMLGEPPPLDDRFGSTTEQSARRFTVKARAVSAATALDAIVRAHGAAIWSVREDEPGRLISFLTFDGSGIGSSRRELQ